MSFLAISVSAERIATAIEIIAHYRDNVVLAEDVPWVPTLISML